MDNNDYTKKKLSKVKVSDISKLKTIKALFDEKLMETTSDITREEIESKFLDMITKDIASKFKVAVDAITDETLETIYKRIKSQYKKTFKFISKVVEEEKHIKDSEMKLVLEEKREDLEKITEEKREKLRNLILKQEDNKRKLKETYDAKLEKFFTENKITLGQLMNEESNIIITTRNNEESYDCKSGQVVQLFAQKHNEEAMEITRELLSLFNQTQSLHKSVAEDYLQMENEFLEQEKQLEHLKSFRSNLENILLKNNILY